MNVQPFQNSPQRVLTNELLTNCKASQGGLQRDLLWVQFNSIICFNDLDNGTETLLTKSVRETKLRWVANTLEDEIKIQNDPDKLGKSFKIHKIKISKTLGKGEFHCINMKWGRTK